LKSKIKINKNKIIKKVISIYDFTWSLELDFTGHFSKEILRRIQYAAEADIIIYGDPGKALLVRRGLRRYPGFDCPIESNEYRDVMGCNLFDGCLVLNSQVQRMTWAIRFVHFCGSRH
jgi:hypothetical protein